MRNRNKTQNSSPTLLPRLSFSSPFFPPRGKWVFPTGCGSSRVSPVWVLTMGCSQPGMPGPASESHLQSHICYKPQCFVSSRLLQGSNMGFFSDCRWISASPSTSTGCRGRAVLYSALAPAAPPPAPPSLTLMSGGHFLPLLSQMLLCSLFYHSLNMLLQRWDQA